MIFSKFKLSQFVLLAFCSILFFFTSCEREEINPLTTVDGQEISQQEYDEVMAETERIKSYGPEVVAAYDAYIAGEELGYFAPLGETESDEFDWSRYAEIMEHTQIMKVLMANDALDTYTSNLPYGTYLNKSHVQEYTPELLSFVDNPITDSAFKSESSSGCTVVVITPWSPCSGCKIVGGCVGCNGAVTIVFGKTWCRHISTTCSCYTERRNVAGC